MDPAYSLALVTGLLGGFGHCVGMCGPLVASLALSRGGASRTLGERLALGLQYHGGRLATYAAIGAAMGTGGSFANTAGSLAGLQEVAAILSGLVMVAMGLGIAGLWKGMTLFERHNRALLRLAGRAMASTAAFRTVLLGLVMGFLPCGLSYTAFIAAAGTGSAARGLAIALLFGLGTLPALLAFGTLVASLGASVRLWITRAGGVAVTAMGVYYLLRGLALHA